MGRKVERLSGDAWKLWATELMNRCIDTDSFIDGYPANEELTVQGVSVRVFIDSSVSSVERKTMEANFCKNRDVSDFEFRVIPTSWFAEGVLEKAKAKATTQQ